jgi:hypothetical protein
MKTCTVAVALSASLFVAVATYRLSLLLLVHAEAQLVIPEPVFDFGEVNGHKLLKHEFVLRNEGRVKLVIRNIRPGCGCTVASISSKIIPPRGKVTLLAVMSLEGFRGLQEKTLLVESDDPKNPSVVIRMNAIVDTNIRCEPGRVVFGNVISGDKPKKELILSAKRPGFEFHVVQVSTTLPFIKVYSECISAGSEYRLHVEIDGPIKVGEFLGGVTVFTDDANESLIPIPVVGTSVGDVVVKPVDLVVSGEAGTNVKRWIVISPGARKTLAVTAVTPPMPQIKTSIFKKEDGSYEIEVDNIPVDASLTGKSLIIMTDSPNSPEIKIPFRLIQ